MAKKAASKKQQNVFKKLATKATATRRSMFVTGLVGVLIFSSIGYYVINRSSAAIDYAAVCGSGYSYDASSNIYATINGSEKVLGEVRLYRKVVNSRPRYCGVTMSRAYTNGTSKSMSISINVSGVNKDSDTGKYKYYAGPVYSGSVSGSSCVQVKGYIVWGGKTYRALDGSDYRCDDV